MDGGAWWATVHGVAESRTRLSDFPFTFHFHALEKETAAHSSVLAWRIPGMEESGGLLSVGSHRVGHDWSDLAAAAACWRIEQTGHFSSSFCILIKYFFPFFPHFSLFNTGWESCTSCCFSMLLIEKIFEKLQLATWDFPDGASGKEPTCQCRRHKKLRFNPWVRRIPWRRAWQSTPVFLLGESNGQRSLVGCSPWGRRKSSRIEVTLLTHTHTHTHTHGLIYILSILLFLRLTF